MGELAGTLGLTESRRGPRFTCLSSINVYGEAKSTGALVQSTEGNSLSKVWYMNKPSAKDKYSHVGPGVERSGSYNAMHAELCRVSKALIILRDPFSYLINTNDSPDRVMRFGAIQEGKKVAA